MDSHFLARVYVSRGRSFTFPEQQRLPDLPQTGVCFSGGGTRALTAGLGQLRGLVASGLLEHVGYVSCVSGGSWIATAFTYYTDGARNDQEFLGPVTPPQDISDASLGTLPATCFGSTATLEFKKILLDYLKDSAVPRSQVWIRAVGEIFFKPFGMYDAQNPSYFSLDEATVAGIVERNPALAGARFQTVREAPGDARRPFLVINSTLVWPVSDLRHENLVTFEYTPLSAGSPFLLKIGYNPLLTTPVYRTVGGGFVEPFAYGSPAPAAPPDAQGQVELAPPVAPFTLADASGTSSAAYAGIFDEGDPSLSPHEDYWPVTGAGGAPTLNYAFGDGGLSDNYGLIALLLRKVPRIAVFINTEKKLSLTYQPSSGALPSADDIDDSLPAFFGMSVKELVGHKDPYPNNQVFPKGDFAKVVTLLQEAKAAGKPVVARTELAVQDNDWWGVTGGWVVEVCWVYLDRIADWESRLPSALQQQVRQGNDPAVPIGPFRDFPNYKTIDEDLFDLIQLTSAQVNLMADLTCWAVQNAPELRQVLAGGS